MLGQFRPDFPGYDMLVHVRIITARLVQVRPL